MSLSPNRILCNNTNLVSGGTLSSTAQRPSDRIIRTAQTKRGGGVVRVLGPYTGPDDTVVDVEITAGVGGDLTTSAPLIQGVGNGQLTVDSLAPAAVPETLTFTLVDAGDPPAAALLEFYGATLAARVTGAAGNALGITATRNLVDVPSQYATLAAIDAGQAEMTGPEWDWGQPAAIDAGIPPGALRVRFDGFPTVHRAWKVWSDGQFAYRLDPAPQWDVPADTAIYTVTGDYDLTITNGVDTETYAGVVTVYDFLSRLQARSALVEVRTAVALDTAPGGMAVTDIPLRTDAHALPARAETDANVPPLAVHQVDPSGNTENLIIEHKGANLWSVTGSVSGLIGEATTGVRFGAATQFTIPAIALQPDEQPLITGVFKGVAREEAESLPNVCFKPLKMGARASDKSVTFVYTERPPTDCNCEDSPALAVSDKCLGLISSGGIMATSPFTPASISRLTSLYEWVADTVRFNSQYIQSVPLPTSSSSLIAPSVQAGMVPDLRALAADFETTLLNIQDDVGAVAVWDEAVAELQADLSAFVGDEPVYNAPSTELAGEALLAGDFVGLMSVNSAAGNTITAVADSAISGGVSNGSVVYVWWQGGAWRCKEVGLNAPLGVSWWVGVVNATVAAGANATVIVNGDASAKFVGAISAGGDGIIFTTDGFLAPDPAGAVSPYFVALTDAASNVVTVRVTQATPLKEQRVYKAVPGAIRYGFVEANINAAATGTVKWYGTNALLAGLSVGSRYMPSTTTPGGLELYASGTDMTSGKFVVEAVTPTSADVMAYHPNGTVNMVYANSVLFDRHRARLAQALITAGISPKSDASSGIAAGDGCWRDTGATHWWVDETGKYLPVFTNESYVSASLGADGEPYSTQEFGFGLITECENRLKVGDTITITLQGAANATAYAVDDRFILPLIAAGAAEFAGGNDGDNTHTWSVRGSASGDLPDWAWDPDAPVAYNGLGSPVQTSLTPGGIPFETGDVITLTIEGGTLRWRRDGGAWNNADIYANPITSLGDGLTLVPQVGASPSFITGDVWQYRAEALHGLSRLKQPRIGKAFGWDGAAVQIDVDLGSVQPIEAVLIGLHTLPDTATLTLSAGNAAIGDWIVSPAWRAGAILAVPATGATARYLRLTIAGAGAGATIGWLWAGVGWRPTVSPSSAKLVRQYGVSRGVGLNPSALYRGKGYGGSWEWSPDDGGMLDSQAMQTLTDLADHVIGNGMEPVCVVNSLPSGEGVLVVLDTDELEFTDSWRWHGADRIVSVQLPFRAVLS